MSKKSPKSMRTPKAKRCIWCRTTHKQKDKMIEDEDEDEDSDNDNEDGEDDDDEYMLNVHMH